MIWNEIPAWNTYVGAGFIILSAIFILRRETALKKEIQPEKFSIQRQFLFKKVKIFSKKVNFNSIRKGEIIGEHEVNFSSGKEIITLNHEAFDRALYSEGALSAAKWLMNKKSGLYSMRDLMNFK